MAIKDFITSDANARDMVEEAERLARDIQRDVSTSQIRNAYGTVKKLEMAGELTPQTYRQILLLKPKLAYARGRADGRKRDSYQKLENALGQAIDAIDPRDVETFRRFCQFFEAILAYHKAYGGK
jgi:CRISPR-associated protein Csm2